MRRPWWSLPRCFSGCHTDSLSVPGRDSRQHPSPAVEIIPSKGKINGQDFVQLTDIIDKVSSYCSDGQTCSTHSNLTSSISLLTILKHEIRDGQLSFRGKRVLELGCGHGLPGTFACLKGASTVHFHDLSAETIRKSTIPNVVGNLHKARDLRNRIQPESPLTHTSRHALDPATHFYAGDYGDLHAFLSNISIPNKSSFSDDDDFDGLSGHSLRKSPGVRAWEKAYIESVPISDEEKEKEKEQEKVCGGYDIILISEIPDSMNSLKKIYGLISNCLRPPYGVLYLTVRKNNYVGFNGGGNSARMLKGIAKEGGLILRGHILVEIGDREIWKFFCI